MGPLLFLKAALPWAGFRVYRRGVTAQEQEYAEALASAIVDSLERLPVSGVLTRVVIRWFDSPDYLTIHALGSDEASEMSDGDAWYPLEWPNEEREIGRVDGVMQDARLASAVRDLVAEVGDDGWDWESQPEPLVTAAKELRRAIEARAIPTESHFAVGVSHFEGPGPAESVPLANPREVVALLAERNELPDE